MNNDANQQAGNPAGQQNPAGHCAPGEDGKADQPTLPKDSCPPAGGSQPEAPAPPTIEACKQPCDCPDTPGSTSNCFDQLIADQARAISEAERAKSFKADLEALLQKAKAAQEDYTIEKYNLMLERWKQQDHDIVELIHRLTCATPCWKCVLECQVCALFNKVRDLELQLKGTTGKRYETVDSLYDLRYWRERDLEVKQATFDRVKAVLTAWEKPAADIDAVLNDNLKLITAIKTSDSPKALYDLFIRLIPNHLAIAPPATATTTTGIGKKYTLLCCCDEREPDDCCGPDVGEQTVRRRMQARHAYLVEPAKYFSIICCLVNNRYLPAKDALAKAEGALAGTVADIKRVSDEIKSRMENLEKEAKAQLAKPFDCKDYQPKAPKSDQQQL